MKNTIPKYQKNGYNIEIYEPMNNAKDFNEDLAIRLDMKMLKNDNQQYYIEHIEEPCI